MAIIETERFIQDYAQAVRDGTAAVFAGAGLSMDAGFVDWKGLLRPLADELKLSVDREHDLVKVAQYHINHHRNRHDLEELILNEFSTRRARIAESHRILSRLPIGVFWTTNYDRSIETALEQAGKLVDIKHVQSQLPHALYGRDAILYKMHGDCRSPESAVLAKEDYEKYHFSRGDFLSALSNDLMSKTFVFLGFSFSDPNMDYVLGRIYAKHDSHQKKHYCLLAAETKRAGESDEDFAYRQAKRDFMIRDLERYNIRVVLLDSYDQVPQVLQAIEWRLKRNAVFVSGAAHNYGALGDHAGQQFVHDLGGRLMAEGYRLVTGLGLGVGSTLLDGALQTIYRVQRKSLRDQIVIRPFPQSASGKDLWTAYRHDMLTFAGLAVFMFGNKLSDDKLSVVPSTGMVEEFDIARAQGAKVLPLGFTGDVARSLYDQVNAKFDDVYPNATSSFRRHFADLGNTARTLAEQQATVLMALKELQDM